MSSMDRDYLAQRFIVPALPPSECRASQPGAEPPNQANVTAVGRGVAGERDWTRGSQSHLGLWIFNRKLEDPKHPKTNIVMGVGIFMKCIGIKQLILLF